jgi:chemotaxis protein CheZ
MAAPTPDDPRAEMAAALRALLAAYDVGDLAGFDRGCSELTRQQGDALFGRIARLTRELHEAMAEVRLDARLARLAGDEIPDARSRLDHVMRLTENAAHRTLDLVDEARQIAGEVEGQSRQLALIGRAGGSVAPVVKALGVQALALRQTLSELAMAQEYQDLAGQTIKRVIALVINVESALLGVLRGSPLPPPAKAEDGTPADPRQALLGPTLPGEPAANQQDADELLAGLGF